MDPIRRHALTFASSTTAQSKPNEPLAKPDPLQFIIVGTDAAVKDYIRILKEQGDVVRREEISPTASVPSQEHRSSTPGGHLTTQSPEKNSPTRSSGKSPQKSFRLVRDPLDGNTLDARAFRAAMRNAPMSVAPPSSLAPARSLHQAAIRHVEIEPQRTEPEYNWMKGEAWGPERLRAELGTAATPGGPRLSGSTQVRPADTKVESKRVHFEKQEFSDQDTIDKLIRKVTFNQEKLNKEGLSSGRKIKPNTFVRYSKNIKKFCEDLKKQSSKISEEQKTKLLGQIMWMVDHLEKYPPSEPAGRAFNDAKQEFDSLLETLGYSR